MSKPTDEFDERSRCQKCAKAGKEEPRILVQLPEGWSSSDRGMPDMIWPTREELDKGYEGTLWTARRGDQKLEIRWMGNYAKYFCRAYVKSGDDENPAEATTVDYPHEVIDWLTRWFQKLGTSLPPDP